MSQSTEFVGSPRKDFCRGKTFVEFTPAFLADWLWRETECFEGSLTPKVFVLGDFVEVLTSASKMKDVYVLVSRWMRAYIYLPLISRVLRRDPVKTSYGMSANVVSVVIFDCIWTLLVKKTILIAMTEVCLGRLVVRTFYSR